MHEFVPQRTAAYISQQDLQLGELTVRETLDFSGRCQGVGTRSGEHQSQFCCKLIINKST
jgi:ABC-type multidrug transport system ATPase subunit